MFSLLCRLVYLFFLFVPIWTATYRRTLNMNSMINVEKSRTKLIFVCLCVCSCLSVSLFLSRYIYACIWHCLCPQSPPRPFAPLTLADSFVCICAPCVYWAVVYFFFFYFLILLLLLLHKNRDYETGSVNIFRTHTNRISTLANGVPVCAIVLFSLPSHHISYGTNACISCV